MRVLQIRALHALTSNAMGDAGMLETVTRGIMSAFMNSSAAAAPSSKQAVVLNSDSDEELACENALKDYCIRFRQLTNAQIIEGIRFVLPKDLPLNPEALGKDVASLVSVLKGRHSQSNYDDVKSKKAAWKKISGTLRSSQKDRLLKFLCMLLGATPGQRFRKDSSMHFGTILRSWRVRFQRRVEKNPDLKLDVQRCHTELAAETRAERESILAKHKWLARTVRGEMGFGVAINKWRKSPGSYRTVSRSEQIE